MSNDVKNIFITDFLQRDLRTTAGAWPRPANSFKLPAEPRDRYARFFYGRGKQLPGFCETPVVCRLIGDQSLDFQF